MTVEAVTSNARMHQKGYKVVDHLEGNILQVRGTFDHREAVTSCYSADEIAEFEARDA